jgi:hypothetical protein
MGCWISPGYGPFSLGARFETYEPFISLIFNFVGGHVEPRINETADTESADRWARLYLVIYRKAVEMIRADRNLKDVIGPLP